MNKNLKNGELSKNSAPKYETRICIGAIPIKVLKKNLQNGTANKPAT